MKDRCMIIRPLKNNILVMDMEDGEKILSSGIIVPDDNGKERGIRPRWATVYAVGSNIDFLKPGEKILIEHGRWSRGYITEIDGVKKKIQLVEESAILLVESV